MSYLRLSIWDSLVVVERDEKPVEERVPRRSTEATRRSYSGLLSGKGKKGGDQTD